MMMLLGLKRRTVHDGAGALEALDGLRAIDTAEERQRRAFNSHRYQADRCLFGQLGLKPWLFPRGFGEHAPVTA